MDNPRNALTPGYKLHWYTIKKILGQGGFGITYLAEDTNLNQSVAIKEFLPVEMAVRDQSSSVHPVSGEYGEQFKWGLDRFMSEAQTLAKFKHPNIVRVFTVFPENNTAYMVMEYEHGKGMDELLKNKKTLSEENLKAIILPVLDGLKQVHAAGFIHRDIKPANIFIREDGSPVLLDFGSARQSFGQHTRTLTTLVSPGFAPFEQYVSKSDKQGPWTDIYGLGATMYRAVIGRSPSEAMDRSEGLLHGTSDSYVNATEINPTGYSKSLLAAIDHALAFKPEDRPQSISAWVAEINGVDIVDQAEIETVVDPEYIKNKQNNSSEEELEKTEVLDQRGENLVKEKPSLLKRVIKYAAIGFAALFVLAILSDENKEQDNESEEVVVQEPVEAQPTLDEVIIPDEIVSDVETVEVDKTHEQIIELLTKAEEDIKALRLSKPEGNNALDKFQQILELDPENADAQGGIIDVATEYLKLAEQNIDSKEFDKAMQYIDLAKKISPDHPDIALMEETLNEKLKIVEEQSRLVKDKELQEKDVTKSLISSEDKKRISQLQARIKNNPKDRDARKEIQSIMKSYESKVKDAIESGELDTATAYLREAQEIAPRSIRVKAMLKKIEQKKKEQQQDKKPDGLFRDALKDGGEGPEVVVIPAGSFKMGSNRAVREFFTGESPVHKVNIEYDFAMTTKEISVSEFRAFIDSSGYQTEAEWQGGCGYWDEEWKVDPERYWKNPGFPQGNNNPVVCISWNDAIAAAKWLSKQTGQTYRLPSEAEWEYAARAGKKGDTYWGNKSDNQCQYENLMDYNDKEGKTYFQCTDGYTYTAPVASFNANAFGLYDMLGNVLELTQDCFNDNYKNVEKDGRAISKGDCSHRMLRGGAWALPRGQSNETPTITGRIPWGQNNRGFMVGFRLVREIK